MYIRNILGLLLLSLNLIISACTEGQTLPLVSAKEFAGLMEKYPNAPLLDVRTPGEFAEEHLQNARNIDWSGGQFDQQTTGLNKEEPVLVYCLSGGRSHAAAERLREQGFKKVIEMEGGLMKWRAAGLAENDRSANSKNAGLDIKDFQEILNTDKVVLIDFYAEWCGPCKKMKPHLDAISREMGDKIEIVRIDVDKNPELCEAMHIESIPVLQVYKNKNMTWNHLGYAEKGDIVTQLQ